MNSRDSAAAVMHARLSWGQADAIADDLQQSGLLDDGRAAKYRYQIEEAIADFEAVRAASHFDKYAQATAMTTIQRLKNILKEVG